jgi:uncharacterized linocin/CFP29 family protein
MTNDPQVPWTDEQWARVNQVIQEEAKRARVAATFLPLYGPLDADADFVRRQEISYPPVDDGLAKYAAAPSSSGAQAQTVTPGPSLEPQRLSIDDRDTMRLATLQVIVPIRNAQMADPELASALALFRRAANVIARLEDAVVFRGLTSSSAPPAGLSGLPRIWQITGALQARGIWLEGSPDGSISIDRTPEEGRGQRLVGAISQAIGQLEQRGQFGPFAAVLGQQLFLAAQTPDPQSLVLPQDRIIPFLGGGPLLRSSTLDERDGYTGVVVALGGAPLELVVASDISLQFLQVSADPAFLFRLSEKIALRIRESDAIVQLYMMNGKAPSASPSPSPGSPSPSPASSSPSPTSHSPSPASPSPSPTSPPTDGGAKGKRK